MKCQTELRKSPEAKNPNKLMNFYMWLISYVDVFLLARSQACMCQKQETCFRMAHKIQEVPAPRVKS